MQTPVSTSVLIAVSSRCSQIAVFVHANSYLSSAGVTAIRPFGSWRSPDEAQIDHSASQKQMSMTAGASTPTLSPTLAMTTAPTLAGLSPAPSARVPSPATTERVPSSGPASSTGAGRQAVGSEGQPPRVTQLVDSGLRLPGEEAVILPPPYSRE